MKQRERPARSIVRRRRTMPGSPARPASSSQAEKERSARSNSAESSARSAPSRTREASPRPPTRSSIASTRIDLPAPVSPVSTLKPAPNSSDARSMMTKFAASSARSMLSRRPAFERLLAPAQFLAQRREVTVARRVHERNHVRGTPEDKAVALAHVGERQSIEMRARVERAQQRDLDDRTVAHAHRPRGQRVRVERNERKRRDRRMQDRTLRRERIRGRSRRRSDDHAVGAQRVDELAVDAQIELNQAPLRALADH